MEQQAFHRIDACFEQIWRQGALLVKMSFMTIF